MLHLHVCFLGTCIVSVLGQDAGLLQADITLNNPLSLVAALFPSLIQLAYHATNPELSPLVPERTGQHRAALRALCLISCRLRVHPPWELNAPGPRSPFQTIPAALASPETYCRFLLCSRLCSQPRHCLSFLHLPGLTLPCPVCLLP